MNYFFYLKQQLFFYGLFVLSLVLTDALMYYFGHITHIVLTPGAIAAIVLGTMVFLFIGPLYLMWSDSLKKDKL